MKKILIGLVILSMTLVGGYYIISKQSYSQVMSSFVSDGTIKPKLHKLDMVGFDARIYSWIDPTDGSHCKQAFTDGTTSQMICLPGSQY